MLIERWASKHSFRANVGPLWFGVNLDGPGFFVIIEGVAQYLSWNPTERLVSRILVLNLTIVALVIAFI